MTRPLRRLGPGLVAAASNNDPTTVATLAVVGATTGYALCWLVVLIVPMLSIVQSLAADVGVVCRTSLQGAIRREYGFAWAAVVLVAVAAVNIVTLAADLKAGCEALGLLLHVPAAAFLVPFAVAIGALLLGRSFTAVERVLSLLPLGFVAYAASAAIAHFDASALVRGIFVPHYALTPVVASACIALLGTTMTAYVYVWESIGVAERGVDGGSIRFFERDAVRGMLAVGVIFLFIIVASAATLGKEHLPVTSATDMARALEPLAGPWAATLFGLGLLASALLAVPVVASTTAYVAAHTFGWPGSLSSRPGEAKAFYGVALAALGGAALLATAPVPMVTMLYWASIAGGVATPLTLVFLALVAGSRRIMGPQAASRPTIALAWAIVATVIVATGAFFVSLALAPAA